jgi:LPPG:FO 2-phospho-L-lactate transferase
MMSGLGHEVSAAGVASFYAELIDMLVIDVADEAHAGAISSLDIRAFVTETLMHDEDSSRALATAVLDAASISLIEPSPTGEQRS